VSLLSRIPEVGPADAARKLGEGAVALDVRELDEWEVGHIPGALHIPLGELAARQSEIPAAVPLIAVCRSGNRSAHVTEALARAGYDVENLAGGMKAWKTEGLPLDPADGFIA
jgi:rhodanese-related sulfurtransferase